MNITLTRDEWDRIAVEGGGVLFRAGEPPPGTTTCNNGPGCWCRTTPPAEFVEAAKPCEWCGGRGWYWGTKWRIACKAQDCLGGKRRIAAVGPCDHAADHGDVLDRRRCLTCTGFVTVATVVVEWGPLPTVRPGIDVHNPPIDCIALTRLGLVLHIVGERPVGVADYPPDVDPATLVGQYALGIKVVDQ